jgi:SRSO17 transposase
LTNYVALLAEAVDHPDRAEPLRDYCTGLLLPVERKSIEPIAAQVAPGRVKAKHQSLQQFITDAPWRDCPALWVAYNYALPALQRHGGVKATIVDDTGIPKKGSHSAGVVRQYCGQLGKVCNCQVAVSLSSANEWVSLPITFDQRDKGHCHPSPIVATGRGRNCCGAMKNFARFQSKI